MLFRFPIILTLATFVLFSCGTQTTETHKKQYVFNAQTSPEIEAKIIELISDFNYGVGYNVLTYTNQPREANSPITITSGLLSEDRDHDGEEDNKVGWGNWYTESSSEKKLSLTGSTNDKTVIYGMELEFDQEYIETRIKLNDESSNYDLKKLFFHEVGHGLMMGHIDNENDVMHESISGQKNFDRFFAQVREFFEQS